MPDRLKHHFDKHAGKVGAVASDLLCKLLHMDPTKRISAGDALDHDWFWTDPMPCDPACLPRYPSSHEFVTKKRRQESKEQNLGQPDAKRQHADNRPAQHNNHSNHYNKGGPPMGGK